MASKAFSASGSSSIPAPAPSPVDPAVPDTHRNCSVRSSALLTLPKPNAADRFYLLQILEQDADTVWVWRRWGAAGRPGRGLLKGPLAPASAARRASAAISAGVTGAG